MRSLKETDEPVLKLLVRTFFVLPVEYRHLELCSKLAKGMRILSQKTNDLGLKRDTSKLLDQWIKLPRKQSALTHLSKDKITKQSIQPKIKKKVQWSDDLGQELCSVMEYSTETQKSSSPRIDYRSFERDEARGAFKVNLEEDYISLNNEYEAGRLKSSILELMKDIGQVENQKRNKRGKKFISGKRRKNKN